MFYLTTRKKLFELFVFESFIDVEKKLNNFDVNLHFWREVLYI